MRSPTAIRSGHLADCHPARPPRRGQHNFSPRHGSSRLTLCHLLQQDATRHRVQQWQRRETLEILRTAVSPGDATTSRGGHMTSQTPQPPSLALLHEMGLNEAAVERRKRIVGLEPADLGRIATLKELVRERADEYTAAFFQHLA